MQRASHGRYLDPLDAIWIACADRLGLKIARSTEVYASFDGRGTLSLSTPDDFDPDDSLAQLIFHELCHALVQGPGRRRQIDWGLCNTDDSDALAEHACHRLQAALLDRYGLRRLLAVTTDWRPYWDALPADPLAAGDDPAIPLARAAWPAATRGPWSAALGAALRATADIASLVRPYAAPGTLWAGLRPPHPTGFGLGPPTHTCGDCAWRTGADRCLAQADEGAEGPVVRADWPACYAWEPPLTDASCQSCGACCREGYSLAPVEPDEPVATARPDLLVHDAYGAHLPRPTGACVALDGRAGAWSCAIYAMRPRACAELPPGSAACLTARRRTGLSRS